MIKEYWFKKDTDWQTSTKLVILVNPGKKSGTLNVLLQKYRKYS